VGATIHPLRRSWLAAQPKARGRPIARLRADGLPAVGQQVYDGGSEELATFGGYPILAPAPDWS
jgi:hypothetical protein